MSRIYAHYIHPCEEQFAQEINLTAAVADGAYDLGLFHSLLLFSPLL